MNATYFQQREETLMHYQKADFASLLTEDFLEFGTSGMRYTKAQQLEALDDAGIDTPPFYITHFHLHMLADTIAHITYQTTRKSDGACANRSSIWRYEDNTWRMCFHQGTPMK